MTIVRSGLWLMVERVSMVATGLLSTAWVARTYGVAAFGAFSYVDAVSTFLVFLPTLGLDHLVSRDAVTKPQSAGTALGSAFAMNAMGWLAYVATVCWVLAWHGGNGIEMQLAGAVVLNTLFNRLALVRVVYEAQGDTRPIALSVLVSRAVGLAWLAWATARGASMAWALLYLPLQSLMFLAGLLLGTGRGRQVLTQLKAQREQMHSYWREAMPLVVASLAYPVFSHFGFLMAQSAISAHDAGVYAAAQKFIIQLTIVGNLLAVVLFPRVLAGQQVGPQEYLRRKHAAARVSVGASAAVALLLMLAAPWIIQATYGSGFGDSVWVLQALAPSVLFSFPAALYTRLLIADGLGRVEMAKAWAGGAFAIASTAVLGHAFGLWGIVAGTVLGYAFADLLLCSFFAASRPLFRIQFAALFGMANVRATALAFRSLAKE